ncbi:multiubiquitin domain-containing protein [Amycolatopsis sp. lyj-108]|uniref:multiubiquitin domain-containing protein n=1 Tax=Amycolatopsis sp. lyj-108 TaxID=2789286 RepID=UPI00397918C2
MTIATEQLNDGKNPRPLRLRVTVNNHPVVLTERRMTGLGIKQAAIAQGAAIEVGFQLSVKKGKHYQVVGDTDTIAIHEGQDFLAVAADDNS